MAAGDRKIKMLEVRIGRANPVAYSATWSYTVEDKIGTLQQGTGGVTFSNFGSTAAFSALTGAQMISAVIAAITADPNTPPNDGVS
jgi:hypothetical protein